MLHKHFQIIAIYLCFPNMLPIISTNNFLCSAIDNLYNKQKSHHQHSKHPQATTNDSLIEQKLIISHLNRESSCHS